MSHPPRKVSICQKETRENILSLKDDGSVSLYVVMYTRAEMCVPDPHWCATSGPVLTCTCIVVSTITGMVDDNVPSKVLFGDESFSLGRSFKYPVDFLAT